MIFGTIAAYKVATPTASHWAGSVDTIFGHTIYVGLSAIILNLAVSVVLTLVFRAARVPASADETLPHQYTADHVEGPALAPAGVALGQRGARRAGRARAGLTSPA
jgi:SSS family solute:Na+ symporter